MGEYLSIFKKYIHKIFNFLKMLLVCLIYIYHKLACSNQKVVNCTPFEPVRFRSTMENSHIVALKPLQNPYPLPPRRRLLMSKTYSTLLQILSNCPGTDSTIDKQKLGNLLNFFSSSLHVLAENGTSSMNLYVYVFNLR